MSTAIRLQIQPGIEALGHQTGGQEVVAALLAQAEGYVFGMPLPSAPAVIVPVVVETGVRAAERLLAKNAVADWWMAITQRAIDRFAQVRGLFSGTKVGDASATERDYSSTFLRNLSRRVRAAYEAREMPKAFADRMYLSLPDIIIAHRFQPGTEDIDAVAMAFHAGYFPLHWSGKWPQGHLVVFGSDQQVPAAAAVIRRSASTQAANRARDELIRQHLAHPGFAESPATRDTHQATWRALTDGAGAQALTAHFAPLAATAQERRLLTGICERVVSVAIVRRDLVVVLRDAEGGRLSLRCAPPWSAALPRVPADLIPILRLHNGLRVDEPAEAIAFFPFTGKDFDIGKQERKDLEREGFFADEPWSVASVQIPLTDGQDFYLYHPSEPAADGSARLLRLSHETGGTEDPEVPRAGGMFLRLLADRLGVPSDL